MSGTKVADDHVEYVLDTPTWLAPYEDAPFDIAERPAALIVESGLKAEAMPDLEPARWSKLIFNATVNSVAALTGLPHAYHFAELDQPTDLGHLVRGLMDEGKQIAGAAGISLREDPWEMNVLATQRGSRHYPSMLEDVEVWAFDLDREHVAAMNEHGLRLSGVGEIVGKLSATTDAAELPPSDFGIVATKCMHTAAAIEATAGAFANGSVCSVQNGVGNEEALAQHVERVIRGTTFPAGRVVEPGHVQWDVKGDTTFGPFEPKPAPLSEIERLADACTRAGMPTHAVPDARGAQWRKVIFNASTNPVGALTQLTHGRVCERKRLRRLVTGLVDEGKAV